MNAMIRLALLLRGHLYIETEPGRISTPLQQNHSLENETVRHS